MALSIMILSKMKFGKRTFRIMHSALNKRGQHSAQMTLSMTTLRIEFH
jgi:hypothetical protein